MNGFTTRPEIRGSFGVVSSTHWIASAVAMSMLDRGGNAFDAAVAAGFTLQVVEPHLNGPGGDAVIILQAAGEAQPQVLCGQGPAPRAATIDHYRSLGLELVPATGFLAAVVPGAFGAWLALLRDHGSLDLADVLAPAIHYARDGYPLVPRIVQAISDVAELFATAWPSSAAVYLPGGKPPDARQSFANPAIAATWERLLKGCEGSGSREQRIDAALEQFYEGFVAQAVDEFVRSPLPDGSGAAHAGLITRDDMAGWRAHCEAPASVGYRDCEVFKAGPWSQGPVMLQQLALLETFDIAAMEPGGAEFVHTVIEAAKLAFADREAYYGDPDFGAVPLETLLSSAYAAQRRREIGANASADLSPGEIEGFSARLVDTSSFDVGAQAGAGEPTMAALPASASGDTCHVDVIDRHGNMVAATPSGGWLQSSPTIPDLGFSLPTRAQMFWLEEGLPASLAPGKRPRTTLSPSLAHRDGKPYMVWGTPGGDQQDQWTVTQFLRHVDHGMDLQAAIDAPLFHSLHFPSSFYPRQAQPKRMLAEERLGRETLEELVRRGHDVGVEDAWAIGRMCSAAREPGGMLKAGASPRHVQGYAIGR